LYHILTAQTGPSKGIHASIMAKDAQIIENTQGLFSLSTEKGLIVTTTSFTIHSGNIGLIGLSVSLEIRIALSEGLHSLF